jgi:hypothetical protein
MPSALGSSPSAAYNHRAMTQIDRLFEIAATYSKYGWTLRRLLLTEESKSFLTDEESSQFSNAETQPSTIDALWFSRTSHNNREAWELRLIAESAYALFETFEADETEEEREEVRMEMEAKMREYVAK